MNITMKNKKNLIRVFFIIAITLLALGLRIHAARTLYLDNDEDTYLKAGLNYTNYIRQGQYHWLAWDTTNYEHPVFYKIVYGIGLLTQPPLKQFYTSDFKYHVPINQSQAVQYIMADRYISVAFGSLAVLLLALLDPLAGFFLAISSIGIKYTSEVYLEALPMFTSLLAVVAYKKYITSQKSLQKNSKKSFAWLAVSALALGITAASKYVYCIVAIVIVLHWAYQIIRKKIPTGQLAVLAGWALLSLSLFVAFDPYLWPHPINRLTASLTFNTGYQSSAHVKSAGYPFWQVIHWLYAPFANYPVNPNGALLFQLDPVIFILAIIGLPRALKEHELSVIWFITGILFLFIWETKWPQYTLILLAPFSMIAAQGVLTIIHLSRHKINTLFRKTNKTSSMD